MYHYIYVTINHTGKFYLGRHSTKRLNDGYLGSGRWIQSIKDKTILRRIIIEFYDNINDLKVAEEAFIRNNINNPNCMNFNTSSCGFSSEDVKHTKTEEFKNKTKERLINNNPMRGKKHTSESIIKMRKPRKPRTQNSVKQQEQLDILNKPIYKCEHCGMMNIRSNHKRWHSERCKHRK